MDPLFIAEIIGTVAFTLSGFYVAAKDRLDLLGVFISAFLTALGGGLARDAIVNRDAYAFTSELPGILVVAVLFVAIVFRLNKHTEVEQKFAFVISDTLGLVSFSITGALVAMQYNLNFFGVVLLALSTAVGGGVMRDMLLNRVPLVLSTGLYGTVALIIGAILFALAKFDILTPLNILICAGLGVALRITAYYRGWCLPVLK